MRMTHSRITLGITLFAIWISGNSTATAQALAAKEVVRFSSGTKIESDVSITGELRVPAGQKGKVPAVVVIHNSGGLGDRTGAQYVEALNAVGIATLELNLFPRGSRPANTRANLPHAFGSLLFLARNDRIDPERIGIMGFSWGGILSLVTASSELNSMYAESPYRFAAHLPLYPACSAMIGIAEGKGRSYGPATFKSLTGMPIHILAAERDDYDDPDSCPKLAQLLTDADRKSIGVTVYPGVGHGWDTQEDRQYQDALANKGRGGSVRHFSDRGIAEKSKAFAVDFFVSSLKSK